MSSCIGPAEEEHATDGQEKVLTWLGVCAVYCEQILTLITIITAFVYPTLWVLGEEGLEAFDINVETGVTVMTDLIAKVVPVSTRTHAHTHTHTHILRTQTCALLVPMLLACTRRWHIVMTFMNAILSFLSRASSFHCCVRVRRPVKSQFP